MRIRKLGKSTGKPTGVVLVRPAVSLVIVMVILLAVALTGCDNPAGSNADTDDPAESPDDTTDDTTDDTLDESVGPVLRITWDGDVLAIGDKVFFDQLDQFNPVSTETVTIHNDGDQPLEFTGISIGGSGPESYGEDVDADEVSGPGVFHWEALPSTAPLAAAASRDLTVRIERDDNEHGPRDAELLIEPNDSVNPARTLLLEVFLAEDIQAP